MSISEHWYTAASSIIHAPICADLDVPRFEDFFSKYSKGKDGLTFADVWDGLKGQRVLADPGGAFGAFFECELRLRSATATRTYTSLLTSHTG